jgi:ribosomal subunit interface protein
MLKITSQKVDITESIKAHIDDKFKKIYNHFKVDKLDFNFSLSSNRTFTCRAELSSPDFGVILASHSGNDFYKATASVFTKLERKLSDLKKQNKEKGGKTISQSLVEDPELEC